MTAFRNQLESAQNWRALRAQELADLRALINMLRTLAGFLERGMECSVLGTGHKLPKEFMQWENDSGYLANVLHMPLRDMQYLCTMLRHPVRSPTLQSTQQAVTALCETIEKEVIPRYRFDQRGGRE